MHRPIGLCAGQVAKNDIGGGAFSALVVVSRIAAGLSNPHDDTGVLQGFETATVNLSVFLGSYDSSNHSALFRVVLRDELSMHIIAFGQGCVASSGEDQSVV